MQLGLGVMLNMLGGNKESVETLQSSLGKTIKELKLEDNYLTIKFGDSGIRIHDAGQSCCEVRYMVTDDNLDEFVDSELIGIEILDTVQSEDDYGLHEVQFLHIKTDIGDVVFSNHNEHNGYYGGFGIVVEPLEVQ